MSRLSGRIEDREYVVDLHSLNLRITSKSNKWSFSYVCIYRYKVRIQIQITGSFRLRTVRSAERGMSVLINRMIRESSNLCVFMFTSHET